MSDFRACIYWRAPIPLEETTAVCDQCLAPLDTYFPDDPEEEDEVGVCPDCGRSIGFDEVHDSCY